MEELERVVAQDEAPQQAPADAGIQPPVSTVPGWMAKHPSTRTKQRQQYREAIERMKQIQAENAQRIPSLRRDSRKIVISLTEPEAALGPDKHKVFRPLYNVQFLRDLDSPLVLAFEVFAQGSDACTLAPMLDRYICFVNAKLKDLLADAGYGTALDLAICNQHGITLYAPWQENDYSAAEKKKSAKPPAKIPKSEFEWVPELDVYRCPEGQTLKFVGKETRARAGGQSTTLRNYQCLPVHCRCCPRREACVSSPKAGRRVRRNEHEELIDALKERMQTPQAKQLYKLRRQTVELQFADVKEHRSLRRFSGRGLQHVRIQAGLAVLVHNLQIVVRACQPQPKPLADELIRVENSS
jgi:hypothetical protein